MLLPCWPPCRLARSPKFPRPRKVLPPLVAPPPTARARPSYRPARLLKAPAQWVRPCKVSPRLAVRNRSPRARRVRPSRASRPLRRRALRTPPRAPRARTARPPMSRHRVRKARRLRRPSRLADRDRCTTEAFGPLFFLAVRISNAVPFSNWAAIFLRPFCLQPLLTRSKYAW